MEPTTSAVNTERLKKEGLIRVQRRQRNSPAMAKPRPALTTTPQRPQVLDSRDDATSAAAALEVTLSLSDEPLVRVFHVCHAAARTSPLKLNRARRFHGHLSDFHLLVLNTIWQLNFHV
jgi:hypothetical protein